MSVLRALFGKDNFVMVHRATLKICSSLRFPHASALLLEELVSMHDAFDSDWVYRSREEWEKIFYLNEWTMRCCIDDLTGAGLMSTRRGMIPGKGTFTHFRVNEERLESLIAETRNPDFVPPGPTVKKKKSASASESGSDEETAEVGEESSEPHSDAERSEAQDDNRATLSCLYKEEPGEEPGEEPSSSLRSEAPQAQPTTPPAIVPSVSLGLAAALRAAKKSTAPSSLPGENGNGDQVAEQVKQPSGVSATTAASSPLSSPVPPPPSLTASAAKPKKAAAPKKEKAPTHPQYGEMWEAIKVAMYGSVKATNGNLIGDAAKALLAADVTPAEVAPLVKWLRSLYAFRSGGGTPLKPYHLTANLTEYRVATQGAGGSGNDHLTDQYGKDSDLFD